MIIVFASLGIWATRFHEASSANTTALWLFDEPRAFYPSSVLDSTSENDYPLVVGQGGRLVAGKFGNALEPTERPPIHYPWGTSSFGLKLPGTRLLLPPGAMTWANSNFAALMTSGEQHLRKQVGFANATDTKLNLGSFDWTVEFWYRATGRSKTDGVVFEIGMGPRGKNANVTHLVLEANKQSFRFRNDPGKTLLRIPTNPEAIDAKTGDWHHLAFVYDLSGKQLSHYVDGVLQKLPQNCSLRQLSYGNEAYLSVGRDGQWGQPLPGSIDELRFSTSQVYRGPFQPP